MHWTPAPQHAASHALVEAARDPATTLYLPVQGLCEFYSTVTNPRREARRWNMGQVLSAISACTSVFFGAWYSDIGSRSHQSAGSLSVVR